MVFQQFNLFFIITVKKNIMFVPVESGRMNKEEAVAKA